MNPMYGFAPFMLFAVLMQVSTDLALWTALAAAFCLGTYTFLHARSLRILDVGGIVLFGALALYTGFVQPSLSIAHVHLAVDVGMFAVSIISLALRNAFALPRGRRDAKGAAVSVCSNYAIMAAWAVAFGSMAVLDIAASIYRKIPFSLDVAVDLGILVIAIIFTARYPVWVRSRHRISGQVEKLPAIE